MKERVYLGPQCLKCPLGGWACASHPGVSGSIPKREEPWKTGRHPVLKYRVPPSREQLESVYRVPPSREQLESVLFIGTRLSNLYTGAGKGFCNRYYSNKHTHTLGRAASCMARYRCVCLLLQYLLQSCLRGVYSSIVCVCQCLLVCVYCVCVSITAVPITEPFAGVIDARRTGLQRGSNSGPRAYQARVY